jgi:predicted dehydrogenase
MSTSDEVGVGLIGAGSIAEYHANGLRAAGGAKLIAVAARSQLRAADFAASQGVDAVLTDWRELLARRDIDAVIVATPDDTHREIAVAAAQAGKAVLLQKPMAPTSADCRAILAAASSAGTVLEVSFMHRHFEEVVLARDFLLAGRGGPILSLHMRNATPGPDWAAWFYRRARVGGGVVMQLGIHGIDLLRHMVGEIESLTATTAIARRIRTLRDGTVVEPDNEDLAVALYRFSNDALASHEMSFNDLGGTDRFELRIECEQATLHLRGARGKLAIHQGSGGSWRQIEVEERPPGARHHAEFLDVVRGKRPSAGTALDGLEAVNVAEAIYLSAAAANASWVVPARHEDKQPG